MHIHPLTCMEVVHAAAVSGGAPHANAAALSCSSGSQLWACGAEGVGDAAACRIKHRPMHMQALRLNSY